MPRYIVVFAILLLGLLVIIGCDDRGTGIVTTDLGTLEFGAGIDPSRDHVFQPALTLQFRNPTELLLGAAYLPEEVFPPARPVPMLVLLAPEYGDKLYYFRAGLEQLMKEMTASGEIEPMVVYCISNPSVFGGFFYGSSGPAGQYDDILGDSLVAFLNNFIPAIIDDPSKRGIGGIGQGAYGAFRTAIKNPGLYSSVSAADGPLDFDGPSGNGGLIPLFDSALAEQLAYYNTKPVSDTVSFVFNRDWDTTAAAMFPKAISQWMVGASFAFSPDDTLIEFDRQIINNSIRVNILNKESIADSTAPGGGDSTTLVDSVVTNSADPLKDYDFHLPFDGTGSPYGPIWDLWMANNLEDMHDAHGGRPLDGVNIWVASNPDARWNYYEMTQSWISFLQSNNYAVDEYEYSNFNGPVEFDEALFDILREMLKFHSDNFSN
ncbi:hypothetical protein GF377_08955 [candidate division GN15 bacterium]|nr:hypothetical protein [candidate division GN15 bacterium]